MKRIRSRLRRWKKRKNKKLGCSPFCELTELGSAVTVPSLVGGVCLWSHIHDGFSECSRNCQWFP